MAEKELTPQETREALHALHVVVAERLEENLSSPPANRIPMTELYTLARSISMQMDLNDVNTADMYETLVKTAPAYAAEPEKELKAVTRSIREGLATLEGVAEPEEDTVSRLRYAVDKNEPKTDFSGSSASIGLEGRLPALMRDKGAAPLPLLPEVDPPTRPTGLSARLNALGSILSRQLQADLDTKKSPGDVSPEAMSQFVETALQTGLTKQDDVLDIGSMLERSMRLADPEKRRLAMVATMRATLESMEGMPEKELHFDQHHYELQRWMEQKLPEKDLPRLLAAELETPGTRPPPLAIPEGDQVDFQQKMQATERVLARMVNENLSLNPAEAVPADRLATLAHAFDYMSHGAAHDHIEGLLVHARQYPEPQAYLTAVTSALREEMRIVSTLPSDRISSRKFGELAQQVDDNLAVLLPGGQSFARAVEQELAAPRPLEPVIAIAPDAVIITPAQRLEALERIVAAEAHNEGQNTESGLQKLNERAYNLAPYLPNDVEGNFSSRVEQARAMSPRSEDARKAMVHALRDMMAELKTRNLDARAVDAVQQGLGLSGDENDSRVRAEIANPTPLPALPDKPGSAPPVSTVDRLNALNRMLARQMDTERNNPKASTEDLLDLVNQIGNSTPGVEGEKLRAEIVKVGEMDIAEPSTREATISIIRRGMQQIVDRAEAIPTTKALDLQDDIFRAFRTPGGEEMDNQRLAVTLESPPVRLPPVPPGIDPATIPAVSDDISFTGVGRGIRDLTTQLSPADGGFMDDATWRLPGTPQPDGQPRIITYSFAGNDFVPGYYGPEAEMALSSPAAQAAVRQAMDDFENVANIRFVPAKPGEEAKASIQFGMAEMPSLGGYSDESKSGNTTVILVKSEIEQHPETLARGKAYYSTIVHEIGHALTLSHPGELENPPAEGTELGGFNTRYDTRRTVMSYNDATEVEGLAPFDIAAVIRRFGPAKSQSADRTMTVPELSVTSTLIAPGSTVSLDMRDPALTGELHVDQSARMIPDQINGIITAGGAATRLDNGVMPGTRVAVLTGDESNIALGLRGAKGASLTGGGQADTLAAFGGGNILRGGPGADMFMLGPDSGKANVITDFKPGEDRLIIRRGFETVDLAPTAKDGGGTLLSMRKEGREVASVFIKGVNPGEVEKQMTLISAEILPEITRAVAAKPDIPPTPTLGSLVETGLAKLGEMLKLPAREVVEPTVFEKPLTLPANPFQQDPGRER